MSGLSRLKTLCVGGGSSWFPLQRCIVYLFKFHKLLIFFPKENSGYYVVSSGSIMGLIGNLSLLFGAIMTNKIAVAIYLILEFVQLMLNFAFSILVFVAYSATGGSESASNLLVIGIMALIIMMVWIYLWLSAFSFFLEIKRREPWKINLGDPILIEARNITINYDHDYCKRTN